MCRVLVAALCLGVLAAPEAMAFVKPSVGKGINCEDLTLKSAKGVPNAAKHGYTLSGTCHGVDPSSVKSGAAGVDMSALKTVSAFMILNGVWDGATMTFSEEAALTGGVSGKVKSVFKCVSDPYLKAGIKCTLLSHKNSTPWSALSGKPNGGHPLGQGFVNGMVAAQLSQQTASAPPPPPPPAPKKPHGKSLSEVAPAVSQALGMERDTDRPGSDYHGFPMPHARPEACRDACRNDTRCRAWTYVKPGVKGPKAMCYLKSPAPPKRTDRCCVSGVIKQPLSAAKPALQALSVMETGFDRPGGDYHGFPMAQAKPEMCRDACKSDARCRAWTYVKPGIKGPQAVCALKHAVPPKRPDACCVSGVK